MSTTTHHDIAVAASLAGPATAGHAV